MLNIMIFASGSGTNAENIIKHFSNSDLARVSCVLTNNPNAGVIARAEKMNIPVRAFSKTDMKSEEFSTFLKENADFIVLAGFLLMVPKAIISEFHGRMINIHPALLPKYGGKGMYGMHVHQAVVENREKESGITIHYVNEHYDEGAIIFQKAVTLSDSDSPEDVAAKIHRLEQENFPMIIENLLKELNAG
ncbi:phosphoribosylglycinamide formyltransferase [Lutimonas zeaxanthinifaciens]|uniref:phosphoribosylglycinamide formyltransferase n=1 Tax=Lutimonas zeaxanthinifaciens TaxID=3060215 RepID=UPI00265C9B72|nr:phosphoribosylglycinamide formyltransferase [Lutimonas sp. YSD2104]WKK65818.1 phosphoribosylglycinamide formyltransferase [Lutimonas sp. YSD2104]